MDWLPIGCKILVRWFSKQLLLKFKNAKRKQIRSGKKTKHVSDVVGQKIVPAQKQMQYYKLIFLILFSGSPIS